MKMNLKYSVLILLILSTTGCLSLWQPKYEFAEKYVLESKDVLLTGMVLRTWLDDDGSLSSGLSNLSRLNKIKDLGDVYTQEIAKMLEPKGFSVLIDSKITAPENPGFSLAIDRDLDNNYWSHPATFVGPEKGYNGRGFGYSTVHTIDKLQNPDGIDHFLFVDVKIRKLSTFLMFGTYLKADVTLEIVNRYKKTVLKIVVSGDSEKQFAGTKMSEANFRSALQNAFRKVGL